MPHRKWRIKIDQADKVFSQYIRLRDKQCVRCHSKVQVDSKGLPISHQVSHFFGRGRESTRFDGCNLDTLCFACHRIWGSDNREEYRQFKIKQLGAKNFNWLLLKSNVYCKRDRKLALLIARGLLKSVLK